MDDETTTKITNYINIVRKLRPPGFCFLNGVNILFAPMKARSFTSIDVRPMNEDINIMSKMVSKISAIKSDEENLADLRCGVPIREYAKFGLISITLAEYFAWRGRIALESKDSSKCGTEYSILRDLCTESGPSSWFLMKALRYIEFLQKSRDKLYGRIVSPAVMNMVPYGLVTDVKSEIYQLRTRLLAMSGFTIKAMRPRFEMPASRDLLYSRRILRGQTMPAQEKSPPMVFDTRPSFCFPLPGKDLIILKIDAVDVIGRPISRMVRGGLPPLRPLAESPDPMYPEIRCCCIEV